MTNVLFSWRRPVTVKETGETVLQDNFLNPFQIISAFWEMRGDKKILNVFTLTYTFTFSEAVGRNLLSHWETALRCLFPMNPSAASVEPQEQRRRPRTVIDATLTDDDLGENPEWSEPKA
jgi:hypothetical protein